MPIVLAKTDCSPILILGTKPHAVWDVLLKASTKNEFIEVKNEDNKPKKIKKIMAHK